MGFNDSLSLSMNSSKIQQDYNGDFQLVPMEYIFDWDQIRRIPNQPLVSAGILYTQSKKPQFNYFLRVTLGIP